MNPTRGRPLVLAAAAARLQIRLLRHSPFELFTLVLVPLQTAAFVAVFRSAGRSDLDVYAVLAPGLIALWQLSLLVSGEVIARERDNQSLESMCAAPGRLHVVLLGRIGVVTCVALAGTGLSLLTGWLLFGITPRFDAPAVFAVGMLVTALATAATAQLMSVLSVNSRSPRIFQNAASYPFYVLGGVLVPVAVFPDWLQPVSRAVYLSWSADLLRDAARSTEVPIWGWRCAVVLLLGAAAWAAARLLLSVTLRHARQEGRLGLAA